MELPQSDEVVAGLSWARSRLVELGFRVDGAPTQIKLRPWSAVFTIPTVDGPVWFKANGGDTRYEAGLAQALAAWVPDKVLTPLAVDAERGWQLLPDGGTPLRSLPANLDLPTWERFVTGYAELQRTVTAHVPRLLALGVPDHRPIAMPGHFSGLLAEPTVVIVPEKRVALLALRSRYVEACARLAEAGPAPTIQHDDLHSNNVLPDAGGDRFFDWGDASVGHPFTSLLVAMRTMADTFELRPNDPAVRHFRDAYLEPWGLGRDGPVLAELAVWTGIVGRALSWRRALITADAAEFADFGDPVSGWLEELLEEPLDD